MKKTILAFLAFLFLTASLCGCEMPKLFYSTPTLEQAQSDEILTKVTMPDLNGLTYKKAAAVCENIPLMITKQYNSDVPKGKIFWQSVKAGEKIPIGTTVEAVISKGVQKIEIPEVEELDYRAYRTVLESLGFKVKIIYDKTSFAGTDDVISVSPKPGKKVSVNSTVKIRADAEKEE